MAKVGFIGLGVMGFPIAGHLSRAGHEVIVYNRTSSKATEWLKKFSGENATTPAEVAKNSDFVFILVVRCASFQGRVFFNLSLICSAILFIVIYIGRKVISFYQIIPEFCALS